MDNAVRSASRDRQPHSAPHSEMAEAGVMEEGEWKKTEVVRRGSVIRRCLRICTALCFRPLVEAWRRKWRAGKLLLSATRMIW